MTKRTTVLAACVVLLASVLVPNSSHAISDLTKVNHLTLGTPVRLPGVLLLPGEYQFESGALDTNPAIVRVTSRDRKKLYYQGFTVAVHRPAHMDGSHVLSFAEAPAGAPMPIAVWFPIGSKVGHRFIYR
jgi:hypothetical protein